MSYYRFSLYEREAFCYPGKSHKPRELLSPSKQFTEDLILKSSSLGSITATQSAKDVVWVHMCAGHPTQAQPQDVKGGKSEAECSPHQQPENWEPQVSTHLLKKTTPFISLEFSK